MGGVRLMGTSGTVTTLAGVAMALPRYKRPLVDGKTLECEAADLALGDLFALGREGLGAAPLRRAGTGGIRLPGCAVYAAIRRVWPTPRITVADRGLREGMLTADDARRTRRLAPPRRAVGHFFCSRLIVAGPHVGLGTLAGFDEGVAGLRSGQADVRLATWAKGTIRWRSNRPAPAAACPRG